LLNKAQINQVLSAAYARKDQTLTEPDGVEILTALGFNVPEFLFVRDAQEARAMTFSFRSDHVVVKVVSEEIHHKSEVGGVCVVPNDREAITLAIETMSEMLPGRNIDGFTINQYIDFDCALGGELLLGMRRTDDFGPVVTVGAGGVYAEFLAENFRAERDVAILSYDLCKSGTSIAEVLHELPIVRLLSNPPRGQKPRLSLDSIIEATEKLLWLGHEFGSLINEFEINPLAVAHGKLIALDVLVKLSKPTQSPINHRPVAKIKHLLQPRSAAVIGVSEKLNPGHVIVNNLLREGFDRLRRLAL
jgi:hypothetical protein